MRRFGISILFLIAAVAAALFVLRRNPDQTTIHSASLPAEAKAEAIVAPGRVEPASEEVKVSSQVPGKLSSAPLEEGDRVRRGQVIAAIANEDYRARLASAEARLKLREAELLRIVNGSREQERREALALVKEAEAVLANAKSDLARKQELYRKDDISRSEEERAEREYAVAKARYDATSEHHAFVDAAARDDDRLRAEAEVALARAQILEAQAMLDKTVVRSPINGTVLRKHLHTGESISDLLQSPIYTLADASRLRVRVDVDERDIARIRVGERAWFTADAYGEKKFWGRVVKVGQILGKKNIRSDEPTERVDQKILETLCDLDAGSQLPIGLRVTSHLGATLPSSK
jgi:HlyD family secretion protein